MAKTPTGKMSDDGEAQPNRPASPGSQKSIQTLLQRLISPPQCRFEAAVDPKFTFQSILRMDKDATASCKNIKLSC